MHAATHMYASNNAAKLQLCVLKQNSSSSSRLCMYIEDLM